jgi:UDP-N-acetylglucosamine/UDP-N-acetylgalactosamine diphosphorylase
MPITPEHIREQLHAGSDRLHAGDRALLRELIDAMDEATVHALSEFCSSGKKKAAGPARETIRHAKTVAADHRAAEARAVGEQVLAAGKVGVLMVAGGRGTRLGFDKPKGMFPIGPVSQRTLFQIHFEKVAARRIRHGAALPFLILTSSATHDETQAFFDDPQVRYFGLDDVTLFSQAELPVVDRDTGMPHLDAKGRLVTSPNGHGGVLAALVESGLLAELMRRGIEYLFYFQVDNPLVKIADPVFLGQHIQAKAEVSSKVVPKSDPAERMGNIVEVDGRCQIIEYSDLDEHQVKWAGENGKFLFTSGSTAIHIFSVSFLARLADKATQMPLHLAAKKVEVNPGEVKHGVQFERFIFDILPDAGAKYLVVETSHAEEFVPLKNKDGADSPEVVRRALSDLYASWLERAGVSLSRSWPVEISPLVALEPDDLRRPGGIGIRIESV